MSTQKISAVVADEWNKPTLKQVDAPKVPEDGSAVRVRPLAVGIHRVVRDRVTGTHYSAQTLPHPVGVDGVGQLDDGSKVYFGTFAIGGGGLAQEIVLPKFAIRPLPQGVDEIQIAALMNPAMAPFQAIHARWAAKDSHKNGFKVLVVGATSAAGRLAAAFSRAQGATHVIGAARKADKVDALKLFDSSIGFGDGKKWDAEQLKDIDLILDLVWGNIAMPLFGALPIVRPITWVNMGALGGEETTLKIAALRSKNVTLVGSGPGSWDPKSLGAATGPMLDALARATREGIKTDVKVAKLADFEGVWQEPISGNNRLVFTP